MEAGRLDVKYLLVISGESARMDRRLIVVTYAFRTRDICRVRQNEKMVFFFFWRVSHAGMGDDDRPAMFLSRVFSVRFPCRENPESS